MAKGSLFKNLKKITGNEHAFTLDEENPYVVKEWLDVGCYTLNAVLSDGDMFKGLPVGKRIQLAGESSTAKSLFSIFLVKSYYNSKPNSKIVVFESEGSSTVDMAEQVGIPKEDMMIIPVETVEDVRTQIVNVLDALMDHQKTVDVKDQEHFIFVLDSLGMLATNKEVKDISEGSDSRDMTRAGLIRGLARATTLKFSLTQSPFIIVNHTYTDVMSYGAPQKASGGGGAKYLTDVLLMLTKKKDVETTAGKKKQVGAIIMAKVGKSRYMQENKAVPIHLHFKKGMSRTGGLVQVAEDLGLLTTRNGGAKGKLLILGDKEIPMKEFRADVSKYPEILESIRVGIKEEFGFGDTVEKTKDVDIDECVESNES